MNSRVIAVLAVGILLALAALGTYWYSHDEALETSVKEALKSSPQIEVSVSGHNVALDGELNDDEAKRRVAELAAAVPGVRVVHNNIRTLNLDALARLRDLLSEPPTNTSISYSYKPDGTVIVSGAVTDERLKRRILELVDAVSGVRGVEDQMGGGLGRQIEEQIRDILSLHNIYFDLDSDTIRTDSFKALEAIAAILTKYRRLQVAIEGHTDDIASDKYNLALSERRARSVSQALIERGVPADRIQTLGLGESRPIASNRTPEGRAENRRIEFHVSLEGESRP